MSLVKNEINNIIKTKIYTDKIINNFPIFRLISKIVKTNSEHHSKTINKDIIKFV